MANQRDLARLRKGVDAWNGWRKPGGRGLLAAFPRDLRRMPDFSGADLRGLDLSGAYLAGANLKDADLSDVRLVGADLQSADLRKTKLRGANLRYGTLYRADFRSASMVFADISQVKADWANFSGANLRAADLRDSVFRASTFVRANLKGADIRAALFLGADLTRADLTNALLVETIFGDTTLRTTKGLDVCIHEGPSIIDYHTLVKSGQLPVEFLRECGLSNGFIAKLPTILDAQAPLRCFISYAVEDERLVERLDTDLQSRDIRCWYFRKHAVIGRVLEQDIAQHIETYDKVILVCSRAALTSSEVLKEVELAVQKEKRIGSPVLVPITVDDYVFDNWRHSRKRNVVEKTICHFQGWSRSRVVYDTAFEKLFKALYDGTGSANHEGEV